MEKAKRAKSGGSAVAPAWVPPVITDFNLKSAQISNEYGERGEYSITSKDRKYEIAASLSSDHPDNAREAMRSKHSLCVTLTRVDDLVAVTAVARSYLYHGDSQGNHLAEIMGDETLLDMINAQIKKLSRLAKKEIS